MEKIDFLATDGVILNGFLYRAYEKTDKVILSVHGMSSNCFKERDSIIAKNANEAGISFEMAKTYFDEAERNGILAMCMIKTGYSKEESQNLLRQYKGRLREALRSLGIED